MLTHRPFVTLKAALSVDGKLAPPPSIRQAIAPHWLTGAAARSDAQRLRHTNDAILTGIGTVLADNPSLTDRTRLPRRRPLLRVVLDSSLRIPLNSTLVTTADSDVLVLCSESAFADREAALWDCGVEVVRLPSASGHLDLSAALKALTLRSVLGVLVEAGATLNGSLLRANLVDKLVLYFAETELGVGAVPFAADFDSPYVLQQRLTGITRATFPSDRKSNTEDVRVTGYLHDPWSMTQTH
jgi:diaminohydroxyphosphoribosylaminopyrimidine deaminase/5-amino-6-(5-phosphoribosylamino)uracil reductase